jgi:hypothetical protein
VLAAHADISVLFNAPCCLVILLYDRYSLFEIFNCGCARQRVVRAGFRESDMGKASNWHCIRLQVLIHIAFLMTAPGR